MGLIPCVLCWWQRYPYWGILAAGLALLACVQRLSSRGRAITLSVTALTLLGGAGLAGFHVGVEQHWWEGLTTCGGGNIGRGSLEDQLAAIMAAPVVRCDEVAWSLFGISMAGYNLILSVGLATACLALAHTLWRPARTREGGPV
jgi:disulfide bond formation protein DsbB